MRTILDIAHLTVHDAKRRHILTAAVLGGLALLVVFIAGTYFAQRELARGTLSFVQRQATLTFITMVGLYAANMLSVLLAVLLPVDALSGEIDSGVMQTMATKPIARAQIVLGKWVGHASIVMAYLLAVVAVVLASGGIAAGHLQLSPWRGLGLIFVELALLVTVSIAGGTRFGTVANGVVSLGVYGLGFIGGWMEQIGGFLGLSTVRDLGIAVSLVSPADTMWRMAAYEMQPPVVRDMALDGPPLFAMASIPNGRMLVWAVGMLLLMLGWGIRTFNRRAL